MNSKSQKRKKLSSHILEMKFMQRTKEKVQKQDEEEEGKAMFASEITDGMADDKSKYFIQPSFTVCENLTENRVSFLGFNPEIEKLMSANRLINPVDINEDADISLAEMSEVYRQDSLVETMGNKFKGRKKNKGHDVGPNKKKMRFNDS